MASDQYLLQVADAGNHSGHPPTRGSGASAKASTAEQLHPPIDPFATESLDASTLAQHLMSLVVVLPPSLVLVVCGRIRGLLGSPAQSFPRLLFMDCRFLLGGPAALSVGPTLAVELQQAGAPWITLPATHPLSPAAHGWLSLTVGWRLLRAFVPVLVPLLLLRGRRSRTRSWSAAPWGMSVIVRAVWAPEQAGSGPS
ncbi:transmembrane protein 235 [Lagenorhynchus albirostris]|uniref:transmembrane protein 235 n=1 Tax=Lagenorhynchus albirostris TaxID=27610 RepID=UPI0028E62141|nr:transmembrane protein 235 [Lagenorhynchus albirostris]